MPLPLESTIMAEIGLGANYRWYNGSGSCEYTRKKAARKVASAIQAHVNAGDEIAAPNMRLIALVGRAACELDTNRYTLTKTWQVASDVIQAHIHGYGDPDFLGQMTKSIQEHHFHSVSHKRDLWA